MRLFFVRIDGCATLTAVLYMFYFTIPFTVLILVNLILLIKPLKITAIEYAIVKGNDNVPPISLNDKATPIIPTVISVSFTTRNDALYLLKIVKIKKHNSKTGKENMRPTTINAGNISSILTAF